MADTSQSRIARAREHLRALLALPDERPGCWEAEHVAALEDQLRDVLAVLDGADDGGER